MRRITSNRRSLLACKTIAIRPRSRLAGVQKKRRARVNSLHHQSVARRGRGLRVAAIDSDAIIQANLVAYVDDRETYDLTDGEQRINSVLDRSDGDAARTLRDLWSSTNEDYPITVYGRDAKIEVVIKSVNQIERGVAQVRFTRTLRRPRDTRTVTRSYVATVGYDFQPETRQRLQDVWANPLGFVVTSYRVDAETLEN
jgi:type IV secretion system protein VirB8